MYDIYSSNSLQNSWGCSHCHQSLVMTVSYLPGCLDKHLARYLFMNPQFRVNAKSDSRLKLHAPAVRPASWRTGNDNLAVTPSHPSCDGDIWLINDEWGAPDWSLLKALGAEFHSASRQLLANTKWLSFAVDDADIKIECSKVHYPLSDPYIDVHTLISSIFEHRDFICVHVCTIQH